ncbi:M50 family metallopeptidase [bacterium]|nr:M50 family metallopeptidase [bacterium]
MPAKPFEEKPEEKPQKKTSGQAFGFKKPQPKLKVSETVEEKLARLENEVSFNAKVTDAPASSLPSPVVSAMENSLGAVGSASQLSFMHDPRWNMSVFWLLVFFSVFLSNVPGIHFLMTPVSQFVTMVHEMGHAIVTILTGGHVNFMTVVSDGQGHAGLTGSSGGWAFLSAQAGYIGTTFFGCLLIYLGQYPRYSKVILSGLGVAMIVSSVIFMTPGLLSAHIFQSIGSLVWGLGMGAFCVYLGKKLQAAWANLVVLFLAVQTALSSLALTWSLFPHSLGLAGGGYSDATLMAKMIPFTLPVFWVLIWIAISVIMLFFTLKHTYGAAFMKKGRAVKQIKKQKQ